MPSSSNNFKNRTAGGDDSTSGDNAEDLVLMSTGM